MSASRVLFPFLGDAISERTLDAALRLARAEGATLVPAYVAEVDWNLPLDSPLPARCEAAMPLLEAVERRAAERGITVDSRIETGRTARHALRRLLEGERYNQVVVPAATSRSEGFASDDVAWLLERAPGDVIVIRPSPTGK